MAVNNKIVTQEAYDLLAKELIGLIKTKANIDHTQLASTIIETDEKNFVSNTEKQGWNEKVTKEQLDDAVKTLASGLTWKGTFANLNEAKEKLLNPKSGWAIITTDGKNAMYIYEQEEGEVGKWEQLGDILLPSNATQTQAGLMSADDKKKLDNITDEKLIQDGEKDKWNKASIDATSSLEKISSLESAKADKTTQIIAGNGLVGTGSLANDITLGVKVDGDSLSVSSKGIKVEMIDDLTSASTTKPLSANQGRVLKVQADDIKAKLEDVAAKTETNTQVLDNKLTELEAQAIIDKYKA